MHGGDSGLRSRIDFGFGHITQATYFGFGNYTPFDADDWKSDFYFYENRFFYLEYIARYRVWKHPQRRGTSLDISGINLIRRESPQLEGATNYLSQLSPNYTRGTTIWMGGAGLRWENRDSEFAPTRGNRAFAEFLFSTGSVSDHSMALFRMGAGQYATVKIIFPVTLALNVTFHQAIGDIPQYILPRIGGEYSLRGYPEGRFRGESMLYYNAELRTWLYRHPGNKFRVGGQLFTDAGRVFDSGPKQAELFRDHKRTFGAGAAFSMFSEDFILRADIGFSEDMYRIYLGFGYTF